MKFLKLYIILIIIINTIINPIYAENENVPGQFGVDTYIQIMREGIPKKIHDEIYNNNGDQIIKFKDFIPEDLGNNLSKDKNLEYIDLKYKTMLRILKQKDGSTENYQKLEDTLNSHWSEMVVLLPLIKSNEGSSSSNNPSNNNQGLYQLYGYASYRDGGCKGLNYYYTTCPSSVTLYQPGKSLSEYEQYLQLADFIMFFKHNIFSGDANDLGQGEKSIAQNMNYVFQSMGFQVNLNEFSKLIDAFDRKDFILNKTSNVNDFFIKNQLLLIKIGINKPEDVGKLITMFYLASRLLRYNGFRYGTNYLDNPYVASIYAPKDGDAKICMIQCASDGCRSKNVKKGNGALYYYYNLIEDGNGRKTFVNIMQSLKMNGKLENNVTCP